MSMAAALHAFQTAIQTGTLRPDLAADVKAAEAAARRLARTNPAALRRPSPEARLAARLREEA